MIHPTAWVDPAARIGADVEIGPFAVVFGQVVLGRGVRIGAHAVVGKPPIGRRTLARPPSDHPSETVVEAGAEVDSHATLYLGAYVAAGAMVGDHASVREGAIVQEGCVVGRFASISHDVVMKPRSKVMDLCCIAGGAVIGEGSFIAPGCMFANDGSIPGVRAYAFDAAHYQPVKVGRDVVVFMNATVLAGVEIGDGATVAAHAMVTKNVPPGHFVLGLPAKPRSPVPPDELRAVEDRALAWAAPIDHHEV